MGYVVDFDELDSSFNAAYGQCSGWIEDLQKIQEKCVAMHDSGNMAGAGADNIRLYFEAVHYTILTGIGSVVELHWKNFLAYKTAYQTEVDTGLHAHISTTELESLYDHYGTRKSYARQIDSELGLALGKVSNIFHVSYSDITTVDDQYAEVRSYLTDTADSITNLENEHSSADFTNTDALITQLNNFLQEQLGQNRAYKENFSAESISHSESIRDLISSYESVSTELGNKEELYTKAFEHEEDRAAALQKEAEEEAAERAKKAKIEKWIVTGLCVVGSAAVIIGTGGAGAPLVVGTVSAVSGAIISGNNNAMDQYAANGRVTDWGSVVGDAAIGGITGFITGYLGTAGSTAITNGLSSAGSSLVNSSSMLVRVSSNAAIGSVAQVGTGIVSRGAAAFTGNMITSGGNFTSSVDAAADSAFNLQSIATDAAIGGISGGISGIKSPDKNIPDQLEEDITIEETQGENPYSYLEDGDNVGPGKDFTAQQKQQMLEENMKRNGGVVKSDNPNDFYDVLQKPSKSMKGVTPDPDEWQFDHIIPKDKGGTNSFSNCQIVSRKFNRMKWNN